MSVRRLPAQLVLSLLTLALLLILAACGGSSVPTPTPATSGSQAVTPTISGSQGATATSASAFDAWVAAAKQEVAADPNATVRLSGISDQTLSAYEQVLKKQFGIDVKLTNDPKGFAQVPPAYIAEHQAGVKNVPMLFHNGADNAYTMEQAGALANIDWTGIFGKEWPLVGDFNQAVEYPQARGGCLVESWSAYAIIYNTNELTGSNIPTSWADLLKPEYAGKVAAFSSANAVSLLQAVWGPQKTIDYAKQLVANGVTFGTGSPDVAAKVASGEVEAGFTNFTFAQEQKDNGAPIGWVLPKDGLVYFGQLICVPKDATHPHLAALIAALEAAAPNDVAGPIRDAAVYSVAYPFATWGVLQNAMKQEGLTPQDFTDVGDQATRTSELAVQQQIEKDVYKTIQ